MSTPNFEQKPAIEQQGGILLKAGAGSGKTYVLVEHMIYRTRQWHEEWKQQQGTSFVDYIAEKFSSTVLMTFTKLAAGEILVRLTTRFQKEVEQCPENEKPWWQEALGQIDRLSVTTIDGFFYKLVRRGFFPELPPDVAIVMDQPRRKKILNSFDNWWNANESEFSPEIARDTAMYRTALIETLLEIFNDPSLRDAWIQFDPRDAAPEKLGWLAEEIPTLEGWDNFFSLQLEVREEDRAKPPKLLDLADALLLRERRARGWDEIVSWGTFSASELGRMTLSKSKFKDHNADYFVEWKKFRDSVSEWAETYQNYSQHFTKRILPWLETLSDLVHTVNRSLRPTDGLTYGDLEFHVLRGMRDPAIAQKVQKEFTTMIVDEFQDTSRIQYDVLLLLTASRPERLFCVGDAKQAIYGFRGGELKVFRDVEETPSIRTLLLSSNYRSRPEVVRFNNSFFKTLFPLGLDWSGHDPHAVDMDPQTVPETTEAGGQAIVLRALMPDVTLVDETQREKKTPRWKNAHLNSAEAHVIAEEIAKRLSRPDIESVAVLYKKLAPARDLMMALMKRGIGFTAQAKIPFKDDPVAGILLALIDDILGKKENRWSEFMIHGYLNLLGARASTGVAESCANFAKDVDLYGPLQAFDLFMARLGLSDGLPKNLAEVRELLALSANDIEAVALRLRARGGDSWSADFRFGQNAHKVILQTSHGSKGLEYDVVFVAGLSTNGRSRNQQDWIGSLPGAALWVEDASSRKRVATPQLMFEEALKKQKEFAESKRLFYVACTRAKKELLMVQLTSDLNQVGLEKKSWAKGLEAYLAESDAIECKIEESSVPAEVFANTSGQRPFFHMSQLGIQSKIGTTSAVNFGLSSELSVTGLNSLLECPRKFYFKQILKLPDDLMPEDEEVIHEGEREVRAISSSERGSAIHLALSQAVAQNFVVPLEWVNHKDRPHMEWALASLQQICTPQTKLVSEVPMKFPLFGFMISGIPDLVVMGEAVEIWDYKTGRRTESNELKYWQQLMVYAYAHWVTGLVSVDAAIVLRLCYVDGHELPSKTVKLAEVREALFPLWSRLSALDKIDETHCSTCPYKTICPR